VPTFDVSDAAPGFPRNNHACKTSSNYTRCCWELLLNPPGHTLVSIQQKRCCWLMSILRCLPLSPLLLQPLLLLLLPLPLQCRHRPPAAAIAIAAAPPAAKRPLQPATLQLLLHPNYTLHLL
jgi:hypothetical protein